MSEVTAAGPVLVHFFDFAQLNSVRALPYAIAWDRRYREAGLTTLAIHSPRYPFSADPAKLDAALPRLGVVHPVADDSRHEIWHDYGCRGWPSLFLWGRGGALRWYHFGEGEYAGTEAAICEELAGLDPAFEPPEPLAPIRPGDAPGALVGRPSEEVLPGGSERDPWRGGSEPIELAYEGGGAHASVDGAGELGVAIDGGPERTIAVPASGLYELAEHRRHERHRLRLRSGEGVEVYSVAFSPALP